MAHMWGCDGALYSKRWQHINRTNGCLLFGAHSYRTSTAEVVVVSGSNPPSHPNDSL